MTQTACLYIVATPIGNLGDLSTRAAEVLRTVDLVAAEDTRHSRRLMDSISADVPMLSLHEHNESQRVTQLLGRLEAGARIALICDAGTPLISDPGFVLVRAVRDAGHRVEALPGPCAAIAALSVSGLPTDRFVFEGFLPSRATARRRRLGELAGEPRTLICYESSHRVAATVADIVTELGSERPVTLARELTKLHEQTVTLPAGELVDWLQADDQRRRGEFVLVIGGSDAPPPAETAGLTPERILRELLRSMPVTQAARSTARLTGMPRNQLYDLALALRDTPE
ncbi:16S rRNA (cytidine(1402)-2'-O)-methyltransferase [Salinisphaera sp. P385]|uniref:Ribosomal RNA small subunit methyltransferase I n=1 Tax=Spectribacter acetivorans TaxID=3075603 RepID=A0ABU3B773_9GAMM|nr:16S rRNA (cytidine(1402)-2'-O)-methyltransferase [Salinisphaera sp. P385]MDT0618089.1 16S rRNA (cytidine(1402)-2'-O)-methyltransferase [Salinisphaera sp. P385]